MRLPALPFETEISQANMTAFFVVKINPTFDYKGQVFIWSQVPALNSRGFVRRAVVVRTAVSFGIVERALFDPNSAALGIL